MTSPKVYFLEFLYEQLLTEMDGFDSDMKVIVMAATNRPKALDAALCRPGRFSRKVVVGVPDVEGRKKILAVHLRDIPLEEDPEIISDLVAIVTPGLVGADLANIVNEAALLAARRGKLNHLSKVLKGIAHIICCSCIRYVLIQMKLFLDSMLL